MTKPSNQTPPITLVRQNRANLRKLGLSIAELNCLEEIALNCRSTQFRRLTGSYIARGMGISPQRANELLRRLNASGLITRFKTGFLRLNLEKLNQFNKRALIKVRRFAANFLKNLRKSKHRNPNARKGNSNNLENQNGYRTEAQWLALMYLNEEKQ